MSGHLHTIRASFEESIQLRQSILQSEDLLVDLEAVSLGLVKTYREGGKALFCGNGGSAADAQHIAAELSGRFYFDRPPLFAEALHVNPSYMTAVANDYGYDKVYERAIQAMGQSGDYLFGISTSGNSENVLLALRAAKGRGMHTVAMTGGNGGKMKAEADTWLNVPSSNTPRIQEIHIQMGHIICQLVEAILFKHPGDE